MKKRGRSIAPRTDGNAFRKDEKDKSKQKRLKTEQI